MLGTALTGPGVRIVSPGCGVRERNARNEKAPPQGAGRARIDEKKIAGN